MKLIVWPFSTGKGQAVERAEVGPYERVFDFRASDFDDAFQKAKLIQQGVKSHDRVWEAPIRSLDYMGEV